MRRFSFWPLGRTSDERVTSPSAAAGRDDTRTTGTEQVPAGCANTRRADRTQVWTDPEITRVARDASGKGILPDARHGAPPFGGASP